MRALLRTLMKPLCLGLLFVGNAWLPADEPAKDVAAPVVEEESTKGNAAQSANAVVGSPIASWCVRQAVQEINDGFKARNIEPRFATFQAYAGERLDATAGQAGNSEITGNCRLSWYDHLMRHPLAGPVEAQRFTRDLHQALLGDANGLDSALVIARQKMDAGERGSQKMFEAASPEQAVNIVKQSLEAAQNRFAAAIQPLSQNERCNSCSGSIRC